MASAITLLLGRFLSRLRVKETWIYLCLTPHALPALFQQYCGSLLAFCVTPLVITYIARFRNINLISIDYAFRPRLRTRLTLGRLTLPRNPWAYGGQVFHLSSRYSSLHYHFHTVQSSSRSTFSPVWNARLPRLINQASKASVLDIVPSIFGASSLD